MTELQLRLWCLWMCDRFAGMESGDCMKAACDGADASMASAVRMADREAGIMREAPGQSLDDHRVSLLSWKISERMP